MRITLSIAEYVTSLYDLNRAGKKEIYFNNK